MIAYGVLHWKRDLSLKNSNLIEIASFAYPHEAHIAKANLESAEIPSFIINEHFIYLFCLKMHDSAWLEASIFEARNFLASRSSEKFLNEEDGCL